MTAVFSDSHLGCSTLIELLRRRALEHPGRTAYVYLEDDEAEGGSLTYEELDLRARAIAVELRSMRAEGERVLLLYPPRANRQIPRIRSILADSRASVALTNSTILARLSPGSSEDPLLRSLRWVATDRLPSEPAASWSEPEVGGDSIAFLQYTSGSTAAPKGVMVSHANLIHNERLIQRAFRQTEESVVVGWLPLYHDMGLIGNVLQTLYSGARCVLMSPASFLQSPLRWLQAISRHRATTSGAPNFAYDLCARRITDEQKAALDLSSWEVAYNGAEPVRAETLDAFAAAFARCGFRREAFLPCYGLAEATLFVSGDLAGASMAVKSVRAAALEQNRVEDAREGEAGARSLVSCGDAPGGQQLEIVRPDSMIACGEGEIAEIWVAGPSVTKGYWNRAEETEHTFGARLADSGAGPFLRTGDLGFLSGGRLYVTGRLKDLIIIRGRNHYPQDIELTAERSHAALRPGGGAAFSVEAGGEERLVVVYESELGETDAASVIDAIREAIAAEHEVQVYAVALVRARSVPKTSSGKIQRRACRAQFLAGELRLLAEERVQLRGEGKARPAPAAAGQGAARPDSAAAVEAWLAREIASRLGVPPSSVEAGHSPARYGLDSLSAVELAHAVEVALGVAVPMTSFLESRSIGELAAEIYSRSAGAGGEALTPTTGPPVVPTRYPLSRGQQALWFLHHVAPESAAYNIARALRVRAPLDTAALRRAFQAIVERHPALRTTFGAEGGEPFQEVHERAEVFFQEEDASAWDEQSLSRRLVEEAHKPFDLERGPLMRVHLFRRGASEYVLLLAIHHIVSDFWSLGVLVQELSALYTHAAGGQGSATLAPPASQYSEYVRAQASMLDGPEGERHRRYWQRQLAGTLPVLDLPLDRPRPPAQSFNGASLPLELDAELTRRLKAIARSHDATLFMTLLAAFKVLLGRYTGLEDVVVGAPAAGRNRSELAGVMGYFVNPLALRTDLSGDPTFEELLARVRQMALGAFEHQDYPFPLVVEKTQPDRDPSRSPLFQVMFVLQKAQQLDDEGLASFALGESSAPMMLGGLELELLALEESVAQFDLTLTAAEREGGLGLSLQYNTDLFEEATARRMLGHLSTLLAGVVDDPAQKLSALPLLTPPEERRLLVGWNDTRADFDADRCLHELFEGQAARTPHALALVAGDARLTYAELNVRANKLAHRLRSLGVGPESLVGVCVGRSAEMVVAVLGVLKAGGAYVPLDPQQPSGRLLFMLEEAGVAVLLTGRGRREGLTARGSWRAVCLDEWGQLSGESEGNPPRLAAPGNLAYAIYTSGSTGRPKGVMITHRSAANLVAALGGAVYAGQPAPLRVSLNAPLAFDSSVKQLLQLLRGHTLVIVPEEVRADGAALWEFVRRQEVDVLDCTPSQLGL
ncbi:MAG: AMP-binding protein, partial [Acidobacteria bacterium]|nr:AMP-binding protein [Acidobacteriota bacterium]